MKKPFLLMTKLVVATVAGISFASLLTTQPGLAQVNQVDSFPGGGNSDQNTDPFSRNSSDFNMFDLIHRANFGTINWNSEQQNQELDSAALEFKKRQQQRIQGQQQQPTPNLPTITLPSATPPAITQPSGN
ncbi:hypothetical protein FNW02_14495 [Komarekiella sp. 'clone 1']|uniref:Uncharacterized protein n=1 Tax=Komarekiella delphini-convector SJRDD-AB1 TaxID=2593771 RepID=A0AA40VRB1_9NOST|nr:hypothetical protein [Komarekiella delphini-convector]MBD6617007.1 hypothetical protein [Komarekiella delphini-convector SJRDD-AB1]